MAEIWDEFSERLRDLETRETILTGAGAPAGNAAEGVIYWDITNDDLYVNDDGAAGWTFIGGGGGAIPHNLLNGGVHPDTNASVVALGAIVTGQAGPVWDRLVHPGAQYRYLQAGAATPGWVANIPLDDDSYVGIPGGGRLVFDSTPAPDQVEVTSADLNFVTANHGIIHVDGVAAGMYLRADGTRYVPNTIQVADLPAHDHSGAGQGGSLVVGTTDTDATAGSVFFAGVGGVIQEDNANFFWDDGNNRLGINDNTPDASLDVYHATENIVAFFESGDDIGGIEVADNDTTGYVYSADGDIHIGGDAAKAVTNLHVDVSTGYISSGIAPSNIHADFYDATLSSAATFYGVRSYHIKTAGAGDPADDYYGVYGYMELNQATTIDNLYGGRVEGALTTGTCNVVYGIVGEVDLDGGTVNNWVAAARPSVALDGATVDDIYGVYTTVNLNAGTITGDVFGHYIWIDDDVGAGGTVYMLYLDPQTNCDHGVYQAGTLVVGNYFASPVGIGDASPDASLDVYHATDDIVGFFESGDDIGGIKVADDDTTGYLYAADSTIYLGGDAAKAVTNLMVNDTTGYVGIGNVPLGYVHLMVASTALNSAATFYGIYSNHTKTAGAGLATDDYYGIASYLRLNQATTVDNWTALYAEVELDAGTVDQLIGVWSFVDIDAGTVSTNTLGADIYVLNSGTATLDDVYGVSVRVDMDSGTAVNGDVYGVYIMVDDDIGVAGAVYTLFLNGLTDVDYGIYQNDTSYNYLQGYTGIGIDPTGNNIHLDVYDNTLTSTATFYGIRSYHIKTGGAGDPADDYYGIYGYMALNQSTTIDFLYGGWFSGNLTAGTADEINGIYVLAEVDGGTVDENVQGARIITRVDTGTVNDVYGINLFVDLNAGTVGDDVFGIYILVDDDIGAGGTVTMLALDDGSGTGVDYGLYQTGSADNYFGGDVGIGDDTPDAPLDVFHATTDIVAFFESGDDVGGIKVADDDTTGYVYSADGDVHIGGDAAKAVTNLHIDVSTGYVSSGIAPGNIHLDIYDATLTSAATFYGIRSYHIKTGGVGAAADDYYGVYGYIGLNQATTADNFYGGAFYGDLDLGTVDIIIGVKGEVNVSVGTVNESIRGGDHTVAVASGTVEDVYGTRTTVNLDAGTINGDVYGHYIIVDDDVGVSGTVYMLYLDEATGIDYGVYQNGSARNLFGGIVDGNTSGVCTITSTANVSNPPTDAELDATFGTPAALGDGFLGLIDDAGAAANAWSCVTLNGNWWYGSLTLAV